MASTSAPPPPRNNAAHGRIRNAAATLSSDSQTLISDIRKALLMMKEIAVDLEGDNKSDLVKELEAGVIQLMKASDDCNHLSVAIKSVGDEYNPGPEPTNFSKLLEDKIGQLKANSSSNLQNHPWVRQFQEAIWNVHHAGQPMPGEEQEDIVMTSMQSNLLNITCPLSGKPVIELADPVRSIDCKHIYEKKAIMQYIRSQGKCPVAGCPKTLSVDRVFCDSMLPIEIEELRSMSKKGARPNEIEDFTALDDEEES